MEPVPGGVEHAVRVGRVDRDVEAGRQPAARLAPGRAAVARDQERRPPLDERDDGRAARRCRDEPRQPELEELALDGDVDRTENLLALDVELERRPRPCARARSQSQLEHSGCGRRRVPCGRGGPVAGGSRPDVAGEEGVAGAGGIRGAGWGGPGCARATPRAIRTPPVEPWVSSSSGTPSSATRSSPPSTSTSSSFSFSAVTCCRTAGSKSASKTTAPVRAGRTSAWPSSATPAVAGEHGEHVGREVGTRQRAGLDPVDPPDGACVRERPGRARVG